MSGAEETLTIAGETITVVRSAQRQKTISMELRDGRYLLRAPARLSEAEVRGLAERLLHRHAARRRRQELNGDDALRQRAEEMNARYFEGRLRLASIGYVTNQRGLYGSCTPARTTIRISDQVATLPEWVRDYVIMHELAHLVEPNHGPRFWRLVNRYPLTERARGYLMALGLTEGPLEDETPAGI
jgi:predicted metal-dependent hydrolase